tara:strand:+ start:864 stop:1073 length:210 start_codon:yes stop_codon:yes gene_type:complete
MERTIKMKIRIQKTIELSKDDVKALKLYQEDLEATDETFREWYVSSYLAMGDGWSDEKIYEWTDGISRY